MISLLSAALMKADKSRWNIGVGLLILLALVSAVMLIARYKDQKKTRSKARLELENEMRPGMRNEGMAVHNSGTNRVERRSVARVVERNGEEDTQGKRVNFVVADYCSCYTTGAQQSQ